MTHSDLVKIAADVVGAAQRQLPNELRSYARNVAVHYDAKPGADVIAEGFPDDILGLFSGDSHGAELNSDNPLPPQIQLYLENL